MENFDLNNNDNQLFDDLALFGLEPFSEEEVFKAIPQLENTIPQAEPPTLPPCQDVPLEPLVPLNDQPAVLLVPEPPKDIMAAPCEPLPSTSRGLAIAIPVNIVVAEPVIPLPTDVLLKLRPASKKVHRNKVPEEQKDEKYMAQRLKNVMSARNSRAKKRRIDEERVALIKSTLEENARLRQEVLRLRGIEAKCTEIQNQNAFLRNVCHNLCANISEVGGQVQFPPGYPF